MVSAGRVLILPKGEYQISTTYEMLDLVTYNGTAYLAKKQNVGTPPTGSADDQYWQIFGSASKIATTQEPGIVKPDGVTILVDANGLIQVPIATGTRKGLVTIDITRLSITEQGLLSVPIADNTKVGVVKPDNATIEISNSGVIKVVTATNNHSGVVQPDGTTITVNENGVISSTATGGGSTLKITTTESALIGKTVTVTDGTNVKTGVFDNNKECIIKGIEFTGSITVSSTDGVETATATVNIPYYGVYNVTIAFWAATVNIQGDENLYGYTVTVKDSNNTTVGTVVLSAIDGTGTFTATRADTYSFTVTYEGQAISETLVVSAQTTYSVSLSAGFNYKTWCTEGGVDATQYSSLADVFADELATRKLMTVHASADYLIDAVTDDIDVIDDFCANDTAMKWIGLRDYVCDGLTAITGVEAKFLASQYWERYLKDHVPVMTANNAPYGEVSGSAVYQSSATYDKYKAFDGNDTTFYNPADGTGTVYAQYKATYPICVKKWRWYSADSLSSIKNRVSSISLVGSNDGENWETLDTISTDDMASGDLIRTIPTNTTYYLYHKVNMVKKSANGVGVNTIQFYGRSLNVSVPVMTSNNAPYGEAFADSSNQSHPPYMVFDNVISTSNYWGNTGVNHQVGYKFDTKVCVKKVSIIPLQEESKNKAKDCVLKGSNDGTDYTPIDNFETVFKSNNNLDKQWFDIDGNTAYQYIMLDVTAEQNSAWVHELQFYGVDYSEREFEPNSGKKWLYDHGVNLENLEAYVVNPASGDGVTFESDYIDIHYTGVSGGGRRTVAKTSMDLTNYNLAKAVIDDFGASSLILGVFASDSSTSSIAQVDLTKPFNYLDISSVDSNASVQVGRYISGNTGYGKVKELWLE